MIAGVDGCKHGWLCLSVVGMDQIQADIYSSASELMTKALTCEILAIDIPIGLAESGARTVDSEARRQLGVRASSVFPSPVRAALAGNSYEEVCALSFDACGKRLSQQSFAILPKIREVDEALRADQRLQSIVHEVHPEFCFLHLNGGKPMPFPKKSGLGFLERNRLLDGVWPGAFEAIRLQFKRKDVQDDDILDALVALWTARRIRSTEAVRLPQVSESDRFGLRMEMWA
jgi:predicted RNase H-like nuclease